MDIKLKRLRSASNVKVSRAGTMASWYPKAYTLMNGLSKPLLLLLSAKSIQPDPELFDSFMSAYTAERAI